MNQQSKLRLTVLAAALATTAVFAGTYAALEPSATPVAAENAPLVTQGETVVTVAEQPAPPAVESVAAPAPAAEPVAAPVKAAAVEPPITIVEQRLTEDQRIQQEVMDKLARNETLTGKVGVESMDQVVRLSGYLMTNGMVMRANRDASSVIGVRYVVNEIRPKVGAVTY